MLNTRNRYLGLAASSAFAALLISCASDGKDDGAESQNVGQQPVAPTGTGSMSELENTDALLRAAQGSAGAARAGAMSCFNGFGTCKGDGGAIDQACIDQLKGCLPKAPPTPMGCPPLPEPTGEQIAAADDAVGAVDDLAGDVIDFVGEVGDAVDEAVATILDGGIAFPTFPDGGFPLPPSGGGRPGHDKSGGGRGFGGDGGVGGFPGLPGDGGAPQFPTFPPIDGDASIGGGEVCGVPLPTVPIGALKACAEAAAAGLQSGTDLIEVATAAIGCIEAPFQDDIAQLCGDATTLCGQPDAPPNICAHVSEVCTALTSP
jgi:hypothetical protein